MLPAVLKWNEPVNGDRQKALSTAMGAPDRPACELIAELVAGLDQPGNLRAAGVTRDQLGEIAKRAMHYAPVRRNPRPIKSLDDVMEILELAW